MTEDKRLEEIRERVNEHFYNDDGLGGMQTDDVEWLLSQIGQLEKVLKEVLEDGIGMNKAVLIITEALEKLRGKV